MFPIRHVCSLGRNCHTADIFKRNNWKKESYPFDWIFSNLDMVKHCIEDDFDTFLDPQYYPIKDPESWQQNHSYYHPFSDDKTFNHHNPLKKKDHLYFERCTKRFRSLLKTKEFKVFFHMWVNSEPMNAEFKQKIKEFNNFLKTKTDTYALICLVQRVDKKRNYHFETFENIHFIEIATLSPSNGKEFVIDEDNIFLDNLLKQVYKFDIRPI